MSREIRMVPENWKHPKDENGHLKPMLDRDYKAEFDEWLSEKKEWDNGRRRDYENDGYKPKEDEYKNMPFEDWSGSAPDSRYYMPQFEESEKTHLMMYETCTEGTPISPAFKTPEELATWLFENKASAFGSQTATYEEWLSMIGDGWCVSAVIKNGEIKSGVSGN